MLETEIPHKTGSKIIALLVIIQTAGEELR